MILETTIVKLQPHYQFKSNTLVLFQTVKKAIFSQPIPFYNKRFEI